MAVIMCAVSTPNPAAEPAVEASPSTRDVRRWRRYLADERAEAAVYRDLASRREGEEREILLALAEAEGRHEQHWLRLLGDQVGHPRRGALRTRMLGWLARRFGSVFVLALVQRAEARAVYDGVDEATAQMVADERIHEEVVRSLASRGRSQISGTFRAAVFGANDGLVSNLALVLGIGATGVAPSVVLFTGVAGLLSGALSMGAGEYVSVRSQRELLSASGPDDDADWALSHVDLEENELALVYRARGESPDEAQAHADRTLSEYRAKKQLSYEQAELYEEIGSAWGAAGSSFVFYGMGALVPVIPYIIGLEGLVAVALACGLVGLALLTTGGIVGVLSGSAPLPRALRQLAIGYGAAAATYVLGLLFGATIA